MSNYIPVIPSTSKQQATLPYSERTSLFVSRKLRRVLLQATMGLAVLVVTVGIESADAEAQETENLVDLTWIDPAQAETDDPDFLIQGEYGVERGASKWGVQVVALGGGAFDGYLLEGGLPGAGWNPHQHRIKLSGKRRNEEIKFEHVDSDATAVIRDRTIQVFRKDELIAELPRIERKSPTLGAEPPEGAVVLFDGKSSDAWINGRVENGLLLNNDITSRQKFTSYLLHLEFRTPYKPYARKQRRGNSGIYHQGRYEIQVLDSFGLEGLKNECGGIYSIAAPLVNACLPPLAWQTFDTDFTSARFDEESEIIKHARMTVRLNGVLVQDEQQLPHTTAAAPVKTISAVPGPIFIQHHKNTVYYRNIWIVPK